MIHELTLGNFQGFSTTQKIRLAPLTLIFGPNSSGKSSISRSLLLMQQSLGGFVSNNSNLVFRGQSIDLASYSNVVYRHNLDNYLTVGIDVPVTLSQMTSARGGSLARSQVLHSVQGKNVSCKFVLNDEGLKSVRFQFSFERNTAVPSRTSLVGGGSVVLEFERLDTSTPEARLLDGIEVLNELYASQVILRGTNFEPDIRPEHSIYPIDVEPAIEDWNEALTFSRFRGLYPSIPTGSFGASEEILSLISEVFESLFRMARVSLARALDGVTHVKPLREIPDRLLIIDETDAELTQRTSRGSSINSSDIVSSWITKLTNGQYELRTEEFSSKEVGFLGTLRAKHLFDLRTKTPVSFKDVGVGLSQVLPIMEALETAQRGTLRNSSRVNKTVVIEQPELHLHPRMQADLMDLIIDICSADDPGVQVIAETHSENMVLRLQKRIRDGQLKAEDVVILYADQDPAGGNKISELRMNDEGDFESEWPLSFADVRVQDLF